MHEASYTKRMNGGKLFDLDGQPSEEDVLPYQQKYALRSARNIPKDGYDGLQHQQGNPGECSDRRVSQKGDCMQKRGKREGKLKGLRSSYKDARNDADAHTEEEESCLLAPGEYYDELLKRPFEVQQGSLVLHHGPYRNMFNQERENPKNLDDMLTNSLAELLDSQCKFDGLVVSHDPEKLMLTEHDSHLPIKACTEEERLEEHKGLVSPIGYSEEVRKLPRTAASGCRVPFKWEESPGKAKLADESIKRRANLRQICGLQLPPKLQSPSFSRSFDCSQSISRINTLETASGSFGCFLINIRKCVSRKNHMAHMQSGKGSSIRQDLSMGDYFPAFDLFDGKGGKGLIIVDGRASFWPPSASSSESEEDAQQEMHPTGHTGCSELIWNHSEEGGFLRASSNTYSFLVDDHFCNNKHERKARHEEEVAEFVGNEYTSYNENAGAAIGKLDEGLFTTSSSGFLQSWPCFDLSPVSTANSVSNIGGNTKVIKTLMGSNIVGKFKKRSKTIARQSEIWSPTLATYLYAINQNHNLATYAEGREDVIGLVEVREGDDKGQETSSSTVRVRRSYADGFRKERWSPGQWCSKNGFFTNKMRGLSCRGRHQHPHPQSDPHHDLEFSLSMDVRNTIHIGTEEMVFCKRFGSIRTAFDSLVASFKLILVKYEDLQVKRPSFSGMSRKLHRTKLWPHIHH